MTLKERFTSYINGVENLVDLENDLILLRNNQPDATNRDITIDAAEEILTMKNRISSETTRFNKLSEESLALEEKIISDLSIIGAKKVRIPIGTQIYHVEVRNTLVTGLLGQDQFESELFYTRS